MIIKKDILNKIINIRINLQPTSEAKTKIQEKTTFFNNLTQAIKVS